MLPAQMPRTHPNDYSRCRADRGPKALEYEGANGTRKADAAISHEVDGALWKDAAFRAADYNNIEVQVRNGIVYLYGHVISVTNQHRAEQVLQTIKGLKGVKNHLIPDDQLLAEVAVALGLLEHTYGCKFFTGVSHGLVLLSGNVSDANVKLMAEKCVASNPKVRGVISSVRASGSDLDQQDPPFLQPCIGVKIFFLNGISGVVRQVIINPDNRRVVAMTVQGRFEDQRQELKSLDSGQGRSPERLIVLSMNLVRYMTRTSGFLSIKSSDRGRYIAFDPDSFKTPNGSWSPPYPYCPEDVLIPVDYDESESQSRVEPVITYSEISTGVKTIQEGVVPVEDIAAWEDEGGKIIEPANTIS